MPFGEELFGTPNRLVMDPVHGGIHFFEHEKTVIDHHLFQRLRSILQNDMLFLVFPGATHSRFQHSIGAMHIAGRAFQEMIRSYLVAAKKYGTIRMTDSQREAIQYFNACLRLAALLHDTGHAPFSHQFETAAPIHSMLADPTTINALWPQDSWRQYYKNIPEQLTHEHYSVWCADRILRDTLQADAAPDLEIEDIIGLFETTNCAPTAKFMTYSKALLPLFLRPGADMSKLSEVSLAAEIQRLFRTLISGELDVDKMDYLLRDSSSPAAAMVSTTWITY